MPIRRITAEQTRPLRARILRPGQTPEQLVYPGDDAPDSLHAGAIRDGQIVGIASVSRQMPPAPFTRPEDDLASCWQLRGMATLPEVRGQGWGGRLLRVIIGHAAAHGGTFLWCNARTPVLGFYRHYGFAARGDEFMTPYAGPHYFMFRPLSPDDAALLADLDSDR
jgi:GNAT superfamily N-acetyltransferase